MTHKSMVGEVTSSGLGDRFLGSGSTNLQGGQVGPTIVINGVMGPL